jgi:uncharacterized membrane protein YsdA (DUF1294 family)/cold shock CspA family protein
MNSPKVSGVVSHIDPKRNYGFMRIEDGANDVFFAFSEIQGGASRLQVGSVLRGIIVQSPKGPKLSQIEIVSLQGTNPNVFYPIMSLAMVVGLALLLWWHFERSLLVSGLLAVNLGALFLMGLDKSLARSGSVRTPEVVAFTLALLGGSPGILLGMHVFKHKSRKASFQFVLLLIVVAQLCVVRILNIDFGLFTDTSR